MNETVITVIIIAVLLSISLVWLLYYLTVNVFNPSGKGAHQKTRNILLRFASIRRFKVLTHVRLELDGKSVFIENMLIGFFGILLVHTLGARGEYYGTMDGDNWHVDLGGKRTTFPNPYREQQKATAMLRAILSKDKLYNIPMENVLYLASRSNKTGLFITHGGEILMPGKLGAYLGKTKFEKDTGLDVGKVADAIAKYAAD